MQGIHGKPYIEWNGGGSKKATGWEGYCPHGVGRAEQHVPGHELTWALGKVVSALAPASVVVV